MGRGHSNNSKTIQQGYMYNLTEDTQCTLIIQTIFPSSTRLPTYLVAMMPSSHGVFMDNEQPQDHIVHLGRRLGGHSERGRLVREPFLPVRCEDFSVAADELEGRWGVKDGLLPDISRWTHLWTTFAVPTRPSTDVVSRAPRPEAGCHQTLSYSPERHHNRDY